MSFRKDEEWMRDTIPYDKVCLGVVLTYSLFFGDKSQSSLGDKIPRERTAYHESFWRVCLLTDKGSSQKTSPCICCFSRVQNSNFLLFLNKPLPPLFFAGKITDSFLFKGSNLSSLRVWLVSVGKDCLLA